MAITAQDIIDEAALSLNDPNKQRWTVVDLLGYLNDAQRSAVLLRPEVNPVTTIVPTVAGSRQSLPTDGYALIDVVRNMGTDDSDIGDAITPVSRKELDPYKDWHRRDATQSDKVVNFVYDIQNRETYYLYRVQGTSEDHVGRIEIVYSKIPETISAATSEISLSDIYRPALLAYVLHRAHAKEIPVQGQQSDFSSMWYQKFVSLILGRDNLDKALTLRVEKRESKEE